VEQALAIAGRNCVEILRSMTDESGQGEDVHHRRYVLRLGNPNYPCMKLVLEEVLFDGEFFFTVDTHDEIELDPSFPDYEDWQELRRYNLGLKQHIEEHWAREGIPTVQCVVDHARQDAEHAEPEPRGRKVLVAVEDARESEAVALALRSRGYEVVQPPHEEATGGLDCSRVLETAEGSEPDLVLIGRFLGGHSGRHLARELSLLLGARGGGRDRERRTRLVLACSPHDTRIMSPDVDAVVADPFDSVEIFRAIENLLG
jgi:rhodanese-related sulfurtransferase